MHFRISYLPLLALVSTLLLFPSDLLAQASALKEDLAKKKDPIEITADRMRSSDRGQKIIFSGNVSALWGDLSIKSDILEVYNRSDKKTANPDGALGQSQQLDEIVAIGNVDIQRCDRRAKGDRAIYLDKEQKIILKGNPKATAWEQDNIIECREMIFFLESDRFQCNTRVRLHIKPEEEKQNSKPKGDCKPPVKPR